jgi:hypothetical protein
MNIDRTTKVLLAAVAVPLWMLALRPLITPLEAKAQEVKPEEVKARELQPERDYSWWISPDTSGIYVFKGDTIYHYWSNLGKPHDIAHIGDLPEKR